MAHPYTDQADRSRATRLERIGVKPMEGPRQKAHRLSGNHASKQGDPATEVREGKILSADPVKAVQQIYEPHELEREPTWADLKRGD